MENVYINEMITALEHTEICHGNHKEGKCGSYDEGISLLVDLIMDRDEVEI